MDDHDLAYRPSQWQRILWRQQSNTMGGEAVAEMHDALALRTDGLKLPREVFARLYGEPSALDAAEVRPEDAWATSAHAALDELPDFEQARQRCQGDEAWAALTTVHLSKAAADALPAPSSEEERVKQAREQAEGLDGLASLGADVAEAQQQAQDELQAVLDALAAQPAADPSQMRQAMRQALSAAAEEISDAEAASGALGGGGWSKSGVGKPKADDTKAKLALAKKIRNAPDLKRIIEEAGRLRRIHAEKRATRANHAPEELCDIEPGGDIPRLLPAELGMLKHPKRKLDLYRRILERNALQYRLKGNEHKAKGPIIVCIDESGSMSGVPNTWAKAVALAMLSAADHDKRGWGIITFTTRVESSFYLATGAPRDPSKILDALSTFAGGGTDWTPALDAARKAIDAEAQAGLKQADVILITDGLCGTPADWLASYKGWLKEVDATLYGVLIGMGTEHCDSMKELCDRVVGISDLSKGARDGGFVDEVLGTV